MLTLLSSGPSTAGGTYHPATTPIAPEFGRSYAALCRQFTTAGETRLRDATIALVRRLKDDDLPPERVIVAMKAAISRYGEGQWPPSLDDEVERATRADVARHEVYRHVFRWLLEAYFDESDSTDAHATADHALIEPRVAGGATSA